MHLNKFSLHPYISFFVHHLTLSLLCSYSAASLFQATLPRPSLEKEKIQGDVMALSKFRPRHDYKPGETFRELRISEQKQTCKEGRAM